MHTTIETPTMLLTTNDSSNNNLNTIQQQQQVGSSLSSSSLSSMMSMNHQNQYQHPAGAVTERSSSSNSNNNNKGTSSYSLSLLEDTKARIRQLSDISSTESDETTSTTDFSSSSSDDELEDDEQELDNDVVQVSEEEEVCCPSPSSCRRRSSILKSRTKFEPRYINYSTKRRSWRALPSPDSNHIKDLTAQSSSRRLRSSSSNSVSFTSVTIRSYEQTIGDNPAVSYGTPISLDWNYEEHDSIELDSYEIKRSLNRRTRHQMVIDHYLSLIHI